MAVEDRRSWLGHGLAALAISALGLAVAGSLPLTTNAQTTSPPPSAPPSAVPDTVSRPSPKPSASATATLRAFERRSAAGTSRTEVRTAIVQERAAQRAEDLSRRAEEVLRTARDKSAAVRDKRLAATDRSRRETAVRLAQERLRAAIAARVAAAEQRSRAETDSSTARPQSASTPSPSGRPDRSSEPGGVDTSAVPAGGGAASPVPGAVIGAHFGQYGAWSRYHTGLDFRAGYGTPIRAVANGVVVFAGNSGDWAGNHVAIRHANGYTSMSSHMSSISARVGQVVHAGDVIGYVGQTGRAFGPHLHFEIYPPGVKYGDVYRAINPVPWLHQQGVQTN